MQHDKQSSSVHCQLHIISDISRLSCAVMMLTSDWTCTQRCE